MRAAIHDTFGDPAEILHLADTPVPTPEAGRVLIRTILAPIHNHDLWTVRGSYGYKPALPAVGGSEAVGVVEAVGEGVDAALVGRRVVTASAHGTWAERFTANAGDLLPIPDAIPDEAAAQLVAMPFSAISLLEFLDVDRGDWIIQNTANGTVGKTLAMLARARGVLTVNLVRRDAGVAELAAIGVDNAVSTEARRLEGSGSRPGRQIAPSRGRRLHRRNRLHRSGRTARRQRTVGVLRRHAGRVDGDPLRGDDLQTVDGQGFLGKQGLGSDVAGTKGPAFGGTHIPRHARQTQAADTGDLRSQGRVARRRGVARAGQGGKGPAAALTILAGGGRKNRRPRRPRQKGSARPIGSVWTTTRSTPGISRDTRCSNSVATACASRRGMSSMNTQWNDTCKPAAVRPTRM